MKCTLIYKICTLQASSGLLINQMVCLKLLFFCANTSANYFRNEWIVGVHVPVGVSWWFLFVGLVSFRVNFKFKLL